MLFHGRCWKSYQLDANSNDFVFDNQMIAQIVWFDFRVGELSCPTKYFKEASSINFRRSVIYGLGVLGQRCSSGLISGVGFFAAL